MLERAKEFLTREDIEFEDILVSIEKNRSESEQERVKAESYRRETEKLKQELEEQKVRLNSQKEKILREAREEARKLLLEAKEDAENILQEMRRLEIEREEADKNRAAEELRQKLKKKVNDIEEGLTLSLMPKQGLVKPPKNLKPGDSVLIVNLNQKGTVVNPPDKNGEAIVQAGIMKINVHITNLRLADEQKNQAHRVGMGTIGASKARTVSTEVDLRGLNLEEAIETVDKYIDDASIAGLGEVTVIHGKGTGVLRSGIHQFLKSSKHVKSFRLGKYGEGESGVTVVELK